VKLQVWQPQAKKQLHVKLWFWQTQSAKTTISHKKTPCEERSDEAQKNRHTA